MSNFLPQLITCEIVLDTTTRGTRGPKTLHPVDFIRHPRHSDLRPLLVESNAGSETFGRCFPWTPSVTGRIVKSVTLTEKCHRRAPVPSITTFTVFIRP
jgi:hypothetical protein